MATTYTSSTANNPSPKPGNRVLRRVFKAFSYPNYRLLWFGAFTSSVGTWMQQVAQAWLVFEMSQSAFLLGLDAFLGQLPIILFSLVGGVIADRMDRRKLLLASQWVQMSSAFLLTILIATGLIHVWHILALSFIVGTAQAFGGPAYQALVPTLVEKEDLPNAIALNSIQFNLARVVGPWLGGLALTHLGASWCFGLNGLSFIAVMFSLVMLRIDFIPSPASVSILTSMKEGFQFIRSQEAMRGLIVIAFCMTLFAFPMLTFFPVFAKNVFHGGPMVYTLLLSASGVGSVLGALTVATIGNVKQKGLVALTSLVGLGACITAFALSRNLYVSALMVFLNGALLMVAFSMISSLVQLITSNEMRGRVMSVYNVAFRGGMPIGSVSTGYLVKFLSAPAVIAANGVLLLCVGLYFLTVHRKVASL
jgi:predicted MFS family arabinose efflux permease